MIYLICRKEDIHKISLIKNKPQAIKPQILTQKFRPSSTSKTPVGDKPKAVKR